MRRFDWLVAAGVAGGSVACVVLPAVLRVPFAQMFRDFGAEADLPLLTRLALSGWCGPVLALPSAVALAVFLFTRRRVWAAIALTASACGLAAGLVGFLVAMYLPIFALAQKVRP
jgi:hypothetical protein